MSIVEEDFTQYQITPQTQTLPIVVTPNRPQITPQESLRLQIFEDNKLIEEALNERIN